MTKMSENWCTSGSSAQRTCFSGGADGVADAVLAAAEDFARVDSLEIAADGRAAAGFLEARHDSAGVLHRRAVGRDEGRDHDRAHERAARSLHRPHARAKAGAEAQQFGLVLPKPVGKCHKHRLAAVHLALAPRGVVHAFFQCHFFHVALLL